MFAVLSHNVPIGDVLMHGSCGNTFHYFALRWSLAHLTGGKAELTQKPLPVMVCPKCHQENDSGAAKKVAEQIWDKLLESVTRPP